MLSKDVSDRATARNFLKQTFAPQLVLLCGNLNLLINRVGPEDLVAFLLVEVSNRLRVRATHHFYTVGGIVARLALLECEVILRIRWSLLVHLAQLL